MYVVELKCAPEATWWNEAERCGQAQKGIYKTLWLSLVVTESSRIKGKWNYFIFQDDGGNYQEDVEVEEDVGAVAAPEILPPEFFEDEDDDEDEGICSDWEEEEENEKRILLYAQDY